MSHPNHCGKCEPCYECKTSCELDKNIPCSPDCEEINSVTGEPDGEACKDCDAIFEKCKCVVGRPINGISLNGLEWLMNDENTKIKVFENQESAIAFLTEAGYTEEQIDDFIFSEATDSEIDSEGKLL